MPWPHVNHPRPSTGPLAGLKTASVRIRKGPQQPSEATWPADLLISDFQAQQPRCHTPAASCHCVPGTCSRVTKGPGQWLPPANRPMLRQSRGKKRHGGKARQPSDYGETTDHGRNMNDLSKDGNREKEATVLLSCIFTRGKNLYIVSMYANTRTATVLQNSRLQQRPLSAL